MKKNQKGQALIEFVIILPVIIFLIFSFIDLGRIVLENNRLESLTTIVINKYNETKEYEQVLSYLETIGYENVDISIKKSNNLMTVELTRDVNILTPGLNKILGEQYSVTVERTVNYEQ